MISPDVIVRDVEPMPASIAVPSQDPQAGMDVYQVPEVGVLDVTLSGHAVAVERGNVCGLLAGCLRDVRLATLRFRVHFYCFISDSCFSLIGYFFNQGC
jgi:hypothetical protein